jgi:hypothetical protein
MTAILPVAASLPGPESASAIGGGAVEQSGVDASTSQFNFNIAELMHSSSSHLASPSAFSGEAIGNALKSYVSRVHKHEEAQKAFGKRAATAVEDSKQLESGLHRGPAYASLGPARTDVAQSGSEGGVTLDMLQAAESASLEAMNFMFDTSLVVGTMTEASRSFNTLLKAQ